MTIYYVSSNSGTDTNIGTSQASPFATIQQAADLTKPGDKVEVMSGTYSASAATGYVAQMHTSGTAAAPIVFEGFAGARPIVSLPAGGVAAVQINASYITFQGFEVVGNAPSVTLSQAQTLGAQPNSGSNRTITANGIVVSYNGNPTIESHVSVLNNIVHDFPGAGIAAEQSDYITIQGNTVYGTSNYSPWGSSGISLYGSHDADTFTGYKNFVTGNISYNNRQLVDSGAINIGAVTDGEGIIVDDNSNDQTDHSQYNGRTLVANNLSYDNGSSGLAAYSSNNVDFLYNTAYNNDPTGANGGQIAVTKLNGGVIENNIAYAGVNGKDISVDKTNSGVTENYNLVYGGSFIASGINDIRSNPNFVDLGSANFGLQAGSPAKGAANPAYTVSTDLQGNPRPPGGVYDIGALEYKQSGPAPQPTPSPSVDTLDLAVAEDAWKGDAQFTVSVDGKQVGGTLTTHALHSGAADEHFMLAGHWGGGAHTVRMSFINDAYGGTAATDRNLYLDSIAYDGVRYANTTAAFFANGGQNLQVGGATKPAPSDPNVLTLHLSEDAYNGDAQFQISVDGKTIISPEVVKALHSAGTFQDFSFSGFGPGSHDVGVTFLNDAYGGTPSTDRNLYVNSMDYGAHLFATNFALPSNGTQHFTVS